MGSRKAGEFVRLLDRTSGTDTIVEEAFLPVEADFWSPDHKRYTLFLDPGRVKRGILPNRERGRPLRAGHAYALAIAAEWPDESGQPLKTAFRHEFTAGPAVASGIDASAWHITPPSPGTRDRLFVHFDRPLDHAFSYAVPDELRDRVVAEIETLKVGTSTDPAAQYGPVVTAAHKKKISDYIQLGKDEGADLVVDGRGFKLQGYENGFFIGPSLFDNVKPTMKTYNEEIFGPVLQMVRTESFEEAISLPSKHQYGNGVAIFTRNGRAAREFASKVNVGMVGINVPIPVPVAYHTFGGWKRSAFGDTNQHGMEGVKFWTKVKTITARWPEGDVGDSSFVIPTMR